MKPGWDFPPDGDPGGRAMGGNTIDGSYRGRTVPEWMDPANVFGPLTILRLQPVAPAVLPKNPTVVSISVKECCGPIEGAFPENRGTCYALKVRKPEQVSKLKALTELFDHTPVSIVEHPIHNYVKCVIFSHEVQDLTEPEIQDILTEQGVTSVRRITRKGDGNTRINTPMLILTVSGTAIPQTVYLGFIRSATRPYYPAPMQCYKCWEFGHTKLRCKNTEICGTCAGTHEVVQGTRCLLMAYCVKCKSSEHPASSKKCPFYLTENEIAKIRVNLNMTYEAAKKFHQQNRSGSQSGQTGNSSNAHNNVEILKRLSEMEERLNKKDEEMELQKNEWDRKFQDQQVVVDKLQHDLNMYKNLYRTTKSQLNEVTQRYNALLKKTETDITPTDLPAPKFPEESSGTSNTGSQNFQQQKQKPRKSRSRSRSRNRGSRGKDKPRSRSSKRLRSPIDPTSNQPVKMRTTDRYLPLDIPDNPSGDDLTMES